MMNKFQKKAFECEIIGDVYDYLESRTHYHMKWDADTDTYIDHEPGDGYDYDIDRLAIIREVMKKVEKML